MSKIVHPLILCFDFVAKQAQQQRGSRIAFGEIVISLLGIGPPLGVYQQVTMLKLLVDSWKKSLAKPLAALTWSIRRKHWKKSAKLFPAF
jgi:hypothetical protein